MFEHDSGTSRLSNTLNAVLVLIGTALVPVWETAPALGDDQPEPSVKIYDPTLLEDSTPTAIQPQPNPRQSPPPSTAPQTTPDAAPDARPKAQPAVPRQAAPIAGADKTQIEIGHKVMVEFNDRKFEATVVKLTKEQVTVVPAWKNWADETYPLELIKSANAPPEPLTMQDLRPGLSVIVWWGSRNWPARIVKKNQTGAVIRWDDSAAVEHTIPRDKVQTLTQPEPKPGRNPDNDRHQQRQPPGRQPGQLPDQIIHRPNDRPAYLQAIPA